MLKKVTKAKKLCGERWRKDRNLQRKKDEAKEKFANKKKITK